MTLINVGERLYEIERIRSAQDAMYSNMNRFTIQAILTYLHNSPMSISEIYELQQRITQNITRTQVERILDGLVDSGYAKKIGKSDYIPTPESEEILKREGITKELLFPKN